MKAKRGGAGGTPLKLTENLGDDFIDQFLDYYASIEPYYKPKTVSSAIMITWVLEKQGKSEQEVSDRQLRFQAAQDIRQIMPGGKRYNAKKYESILDGHRQKYKNLVMFETNTNLSITGQLMKKIQQRLLEKDDFTVQDLKDVAEVHVMIAKYVSEEKRASRQERLDLADEDVSEEDVDGGSKLLDLLGG